MGRLGDRRVHRPILPGGAEAGETDIILVSRVHRLEDGDLAESHGAAGAVGTELLVV